MVGTTLVEIREHIKTLSVTDGEFLIRCGRTGNQPVPVCGLRFEKRSTAQSAAHAARQYRTALRQYDPQLPYYDLIVCQETTGILKQRPKACSLAEPQTTQTLFDRVLNHKRDKPHSRLVEFCHTAAAAILETFSEGGHDTVESAVVDTHFKFAETVDDPDELCLCLLESMSSELDQHLFNADQTEIIVDAAARLELPLEGQSPLDTTLASLKRQGVIGEYTRSPKLTVIDTDDSIGTAMIQVSGDALSARNGRLPVLPLTLELCRHRTERLPQPVWVTAMDDSWQLMFALTNKGDQSGIMCAPIDGVI